MIDWPKPDEVSGNTPNVCMVILVAVDESPPIPAREIWADAIQFIRRHKGPFFRHSRYWSKPAMTDEQFSRLIDIQLSTECLDVAALPKFEPYLQEARTQYLQLRPHIRHLS